MTNAKWAAFGAELAKMRIATGVSLEDMARATKIRRSLIEALEAGRFEELPPPVFVVGFLKAYVLHLREEGADRLVTQYQELLAVPSEADQAETGVVASERRTKRFGISSVASVALLLGLCGAGYWLWQGIEERRIQTPAEAGLSKTEAKSSALDRTRGTIQAETPPAERMPALPRLPQENAPAAEEETAAPSPLSAPQHQPSAAENGHSLDVGDLVIVCDRPCWLELYEGDLKRVYRLVGEGERLAFHGSAFKANIGDASALELYWHGRRMDLPQGHGKVIRDLVIPPPAAPRDQAP